MLGVVILAALAVGALVAQWRVAHMPRRTMSDTEMDALLRELPLITPDASFAPETVALLDFNEGIVVEYGDYFSDMVRDEAAAKEIREAAGDLVCALHLPMLKRAYNANQLSGLISALQRLHRLRASNLIGNPEDDSACVLLQCGIMWLKAVRHRANAMA